MSLAVKDFAHIAIRSTTYHITVTKSTEQSLP